MINPTKKDVDLLQKPALKNQVRNFKNQVLVENISIIIIIIIIIIIPFAVLAKSIPVLQLHELVFPTTVRAS